MKEKVSEQFFALNVIFCCFFSEYQFFYTFALDSVSPHAIDLQQGDDELDLGLPTLGVITKWVNTRPDISRRLKNIDVLSCYLPAPFSRLQRNGVI